MEKNRDNMRHIMEGYIHLVVSIPPERIITSFMEYQKVRV